MLECHLISRGIDFNTNEEFTLLEEFTKVSLVEKPRTWPSRRTWDIQDGCVASPCSASLSPQCFSTYFSLHSCTWKPCPATKKCIYSWNYQSGPLCLLRQQKKRKASVCSRCLRTALLQMDGYWAISFFSLFLKIKFAVGIAFMMWFHKKKKKSGAWQDKRSEHSRILRFPHSCILRLHFKAPATCVPLSQQRVWRGSIIPREGFSEMNSHQTEMGLGKKEKGSCISQTMANGCDSFSFGKVRALQSVWAAPCFLF